MARLLTDRQADVLRLLCDGATPPEAAAALGMSVPTLQAYLGGSRLRLHALQVADLPDLCALAAEDVAASADRARRRAEQPQDENHGPP
jgi:DNA-binding NarL/FixJ family response regulator